MQVSDNEDYPLLEDLFTSFAKNELLANRQEHDHFPCNDYPDHLVEKAFALGMFDLLLPEGLGGADQNMQVFCRLLTILSETDASMACLLFIHALSQQLILLADQGELFETIARTKSRGRFPILAFPAFDNPQETPPLVYARASEGNYLLSGRVNYLSMGHMASHAIIPAKHRNEEGFSWFLIDCMAANSRNGQSIPGLGLNMCPAADLILDNISATLIGAVGHGAILHRKLIDNMIIAAGAISLGVMKGSLEEALDYSSQRMQGGRLISQWSEIKSMLASMIISTRTAQMSLDRACMARDRAEAGWQTSVRSVAAYIQETACEVTTNGIQLLGGYGYMKDYGQEKRFRDATQLQSLAGFCATRKMDCLESLARERHNR